MNSDLRKDCPMRHENGNCTVAGGFCTAVNNSICEALHNAYDAGQSAFARRVRQMLPSLPEFSVIDTKTGEYPDLWDIALNEAWAKELIYCDMEGFAIEEDGTLILLDECGKHAYCPEGRFKVAFSMPQVRPEESPPLTVEELKQLPLKEWVWIEAVYPQSGSSSEGAYYRKCSGYALETIFECGYPGWSTCYDYADYGKTWRAYNHPPKKGG